MDRPGSVDVFYTDYRCDEGDEEGVLLHELVHASRVMSGFHHKTNVRRGYPNSEEFYANIIEMIYRSERGLRITDYRYHPIDQASVLRDQQQYALITNLSRQQLLFFTELARVDTPFNPIKPIADKLLTIDL
jgi:hypothetical protein